MVSCRGRLQIFHQRLAGESFSHLAGILGGWICTQERTLLRNSGKRRCVFSPMTTFWNFLAQVLTPAQPCRETVRQIQAVRRLRRKPGISSATGGYCHARGRLPEAVLEGMWQAIAGQLAEEATSAMHWRGLRVAVVDGTACSMPDTPENQAAWPQPGGQKPGCGFPVVKLVGLFSLATGAAHALVTGTLRNNEYALFMSLWNKVIGNFDLLLGDRSFGSYAIFAALQCGSRSGVFRLNGRRKMDWRKGRRLGKFERAVTWYKPKARDLTWWLPQPIPDSVTVRVLKVCVPVPGFRTRVVFLTTNLLDTKQFPAIALAELYRRRWQVELHFRHIKTTMHMDVFRCLSPEMIRRELHMHMIAYNLIRALMFRCALTQLKPIDRISFKGTCDTLRQWTPHLAMAAPSPALYQQLYRTLLETLAEDVVPLRPNRAEPRAVKRRPKNYHRLTKPRHLMGNVPRRNHQK
jgi:hypothetical protein